MDNNLDNFMIKFCKIISSLSNKDENKCIQGWAEVKNDGKDLKDLDNLLISEYGKDNVIKALDIIFIFTDELASKDAINNMAERYKSRVL